MIQVSQVKDNGREIYRLSGDLTIYTATESRQELAMLLAHQPSLVLDLSEIGEIDTAGVQLLLWLKREVSTKGGLVTLLHHSPAVIEAFDLLRVTSIFGDPILIVPA